MQYLFICSVAFFVAALTLFSGFGLGTILMPAFALFFPVPVAVAATAVVHLANNIFKVALVGRKANWGVLWRFALPAALAALAGAALLNLFDRLPSLATYQVGASVHEITLLKIIIAVLIIAFAVLDLLPRFSNLAFDRKYLPLGGALSGFFGGLSGQQGALRSAFLIKAGLDKEAFIGTGVVAAVVVDVTRLLVYGLAFSSTDFGEVKPGLPGLVGAATLAAFIGSFIGSRLLKKVVLRTVQIMVGLLLVILGISLGLGLL